MQDAPAPGVSSKARERKVDDVGLSFDFLLGLFIGSTAASAMLYAGFCLLLNRSRKEILKAAKTPKVSLGTFGYLPPGFEPKPLRRPCDGRH